MGHGNTSVSQHPQQNPFGTDGAGLTSHPIDENQMPQEIAASPMSPEQNYPLLPFASLPPQFTHSLHQRKHPPTYAIIILTYLNLFSSAMKGNDTTGLREMVLRVLEIVLASTTGNRAMGNGIKRKATDQAAHAGGLGGTNFEADPQNLIQKKKIMPFGRSYWAC